MTQKLYTRLAKIFLCSTFTLMCNLHIQAQNTTDNKTDNTPLALTEGMQQAEIDSLLNDWATKKFLSFDENCQTTDENPTFEPDVYRNRLRRMQCVIDMPYNDVVRRYIDHYSGKMRRTVSIMLGAGNFYMPVFEEALESYQLPLELKYLPIIESAMNPKATSKMGAAGLWQFMITTGKQYGLEVTSLIDERRDPVKASYAAARYLKELYDIFGDWTLVIAAYNCGPNNINKAIKRAGGVKNYWNIYPYLPEETRGYVPAFIAVNYVMNYYCEHNICPVNTTLPQGTDTIMLNKNVRMESIIERCNVSLEELKSLNPQYRTTLIPGESRPCILRMPPASISAFLEAGDIIYAQPEEEAQVLIPEEAKPATKTIRVKSGDTLGGIAKKHRTTVTKLKRLNGLKNNNLRIGQRLRVR